MYTQQFQRSISVIKKWIDRFFLIACFLSLLFFFPEYLSLDENLTRHKIATVLENPVNLGCYVTNLSHISKTLTFVWTKDNTTVTQSAALSIHGNVLVVTPKSEKDFGVYICEVTNGLSQTRCQIKLVQGWKNSGKSCKLTNFINLYFTSISGQLKGCFSRTLLLITFLIWWYIG